MKIFPFFKIFTIVSVCISMLSIGCTPPPQSIPSLSTDVVSDITFTSADGGDPVSYMYTGGVNGSNMSGTYTFGVGNRTFTAVKYP